MTPPIYKECVVLMPVGPGTSADLLVDSIEAINRYIGAETCAIVLVDDSRRERFRDAGAGYGNVTVVPAPTFGEGNRSIPMRGSLFVKQAVGIEEAMRRQRFGVLLKLDTDALVIGPSPHRDVLDFMDRQPDVGIVGAFKRRGDGTDKTAAMGGKGRQVAREMSLARRLLHDPVALTFHDLTRRAAQHGYTLGDTCTGGAYFVRYELLSAMRDAGFFRLSHLNKSTLSEDSLMGLMSYAVGYRLADMSGDVMSINWRGLPMPLTQLVERGVKVVHPIKDDDPTTEGRIRAFFAARRNG